MYLHDEAMDLVSRGMLTLNRVVCTVRLRAAERSKRAMRRS